MSLEDLRSRLEALLSSLDEVRRAAFYADEKVAEILERLYVRWEEAGRRGEPIDYATSEELRQLLERLEDIASKPVWQLARRLGLTPGS